MACFILCDPVFLCVCLPLLHFICRAQPPLCKEEKRRRKQGRLPPGCKKKKKGELEASGHRVFSFLVFAPRPLVLEPR